MAGGLPHRMRFKAFNSRYRLLAPFQLLKRLEDKAIEDCKVSYCGIIKLISENNDLASFACFDNWQL